MHTQELIDIATSKITNLLEVQTIIDDSAQRCSSKRDANDLGFILGLNGKLSNDVNPFAGGPFAVAFDLGFAEAQLDLDEFDVGDDDDPDPTPTPAAPALKQPSYDLAALGCVEGSRL